MTEMVYGTVPARDGEPILPRWWRTIDKLSMSCVFILFGIGLLLGLAASPPLAERNGLNAFYYVERQSVFGGLALTAMLLTTMMSPQLVRRLGVLGFFAAFVALAFLPVFGTDFGKGAVRWYSLGFGSFQPSEFLTPGFIVVSAWLMAASQEINGPPGRMYSLIMTAAIVLLLALQPDFGQACLVLFSWGVMYFVAGAPILLLVLLAGGVVFAGTLAYGNSEHFARRIDGFLSPDAHTDFIIAVATEEYGLILVLVIIGLFTTITVRSMLRLMRERDPFIRLAGTGLACIFGIQAMINIGVAVRLLPAKGMTLPFVSYGGSSLIAAGVVVGALLAFTRTRPQGEIGDILIQRGK